MKIDFENCKPPAGKRQLPKVRESVDHTISFIPRHEDLINAEMERLELKRSELLRRLLDEKYPPPRPVPAAPPTNGTPKAS